VHKAEGKGQKVLLGRGHVGAENLSLSKLSLSRETLSFATTTRFWLEVHTSEPLRYQTFAFESTVETIFSSSSRGWPLRHQIVSGSFPWLPTLSIGNSRFRTMTTASCEPIAKRAVSEQMLCCPFCTNPLRYVLICLPSNRSNIALANACIVTDRALNQLTTG
jgi:hypothetical protein